MIFLFITIGLIATYGGTAWVLLLLIVLAAVGATLDREDNEKAEPEPTVKGAPECRPELR